MSLDKKDKDSPLKAIIITSLVGFATQVIIIIIIIILILAPLIYSWVFFENNWGKMVDGAYKIKTETIGDFLEVIGLNDRGEKYEDYLVDTFNNLAKDIEKEETDWIKKYGSNKDSQEAKKAKAEFSEKLEKSQYLAVGWVYSRIYYTHFNRKGFVEHDGFWDSFGDYFVASKNKVQDYFKYGLFNGDNPKAGHYFKTPKFTAYNIYDARQDNEDYIANVRRDLFNDMISSYDLQAFDSIGGEIFGLLQMDVLAIREKYKDANMDIILEQATAEVVALAKDYAQDITTHTGKILEDAVYRSRPCTSGKEKYKSLNTILTSHSITSGITFKSDEAEQMLYIWKDFLPAKTPETVAFKKSLNDIYANTKKLKPKAVFDKVITKPEDFVVLKKVLEESEGAVLAWLNSQKYPNKVKEEVVSNVPKYFLEHEIGFGFEKETYFEKYEIIFKKFEKKSLLLEKKITDKNIESFIEADIEAAVEELRITNTYKASLTYRDALTETEIVDTVKYSIFNKSELLEQLGKLKFISAPVTIPSPPPGTNPDEPVPPPKTVRSITSLFEDGGKEYLDNALMAFAKDANNDVIISGIQKSDSSDVYQSLRSFTFDALLSGLNSKVGVTVPSPIVDNQVDVENAIASNVSTLKTISSLIAKYKNTPSTTPANITKITPPQSIITDNTPGGQSAFTTHSIDSKSREGTDTLKVEKYKNTVKDAVKITAKRNYKKALNDIAEKERKKRKGGSKKPSGGATSMDSFEIGSQVDSPKYKAGLEWMPILEEYGEKYGVDPKLLYAKMTLESGGQPNVQSVSGARGLMQIMKEWSSSGGTRAKDWPLSNGVSRGDDIVYSYEELFDPEKNIHLGTNIFLNGWNYVGQTNILATILSYNLGGNNTMIIMNEYFKEVHGNPNPTMEEVQEYWATNDLEWLEYRYAYYDKDKNNPETYIEILLSYYDNSEGLPWIINRETGEKVYLDGSRDDASGNSSSEYHDDFGNLMDWELYYEDTYFESLDKWAKDTWTSNKIEDAPKDRTYSDIVIQNIKTRSEFYKDRLIDLGFDTEKFSNLLAGTLYVETQFKSTRADLIELRKSVEKTADALMVSIEKTAGSDLGFALYHYCLNDVNDKELFLNEYTKFKNFADFARSKYIEKQDSNLESNACFSKVAKIFTGDLKTIINDYYTLRMNLETERGESIDASEIFYTQWKSWRKIYIELYSNITGDMGILNFINRYEEGTYDDIINFVPGLKQLYAYISMTGGKTIVNEIPWGINLLEHNSLNKGNKAKYIVVHDTHGVTGGVNEVRNKFNSIDSKFNTHFVVSDTEVLQIIDESKAAKHLLTKEDLDSGNVEVLNKNVTNENSISISIINSGDTKVYEQSLANATALIKILAAKNKISVDNVLRHSDIQVSSDSCPTNLSSNAEGSLWTNLLAEVANTNIVATEDVQSSGKGGIRDAIVKLGKEQEGHEYEMGGNGEFISATKRQFDCSGLVAWVYKEVTGGQIKFARNTEQMRLEAIKNGWTIPLSEIQLGDVILYDSPSTHTGIYIGEIDGVHWQVHAKGEKWGVVIEPIKRPMTTIVRYLTPELESKLNAELGFGQNHSANIATDYPLHLRTGREYVWPIDSQITNIKHNGYIASDMASASGNLPIYASKAGVISRVGYEEGGYGYHVYLDHPDGSQTRYAHMTKGSILVKEGDKVLQGQRIGTEGNTGRSSGPHLHFEIISPDSKSKRGDVAPGTALGTLPSKDSKPVEGGGTGANPNRPNQGGNVPNPIRPGSGGSVSPPVTGGGSSNGGTVGDGMGIGEIEVILIDAGHGGTEPGALGPSSGSIPEKTLNLQNALLLRDELVVRGYKVLMTRTDDVFVSINDRWKLGNRENVDLFVSIHSNSFAGNASGNETYSYKRGTPSFKLAEIVQSKLSVAIPDMINRGAKDMTQAQGPIGVLINSNMPAILTEFGFIMNPTDYNKITNSTYVSKFIKSVADGIDEWAKSYKTPT